MKHTVETFLATVGRDVFASETGFSQQVISRAVVENIMPAGWFITVRDFCAARGVAVPEHLFRWADKRRQSAASLNSGAAQ